MGTAYAVGTICADQDTPYREKGLNMRRKGGILSALTGGLLLAAAFVTSGTAHAATSSVAGQTAASWVTSVTVQHVPTAADPVLVETVSLVPAGAVKPAAKIGVGTYSCQIQAGISHTASWSSITGHAQTYGCVGAAACHQTADLWSYQAHLTNGWSPFKDGPTTSGCSTAHASIVSSICYATSLPWLYRATGIFHVTWVNGNTSSTTLTTGIIGSDHVC